MTPDEHQTGRSGVRERARLERPFVLLFAFLLAGLCSPALAQDTTVRRVLALRVSFPQELPDDETTSGDGTFDLRSFEEASDDYRFPFDTPPHNRSYFEAHMRALAHYYTTVSEGRLTIEYTVLPQGESDSYVLDRELINYGNGRTRQEINTRIVELFRDGILAADQAEGAALDFSDYDDVIVIHAGLGGESSNQLNDVPSAFINPGDLDTYVEGPIPVDGGSLTIDRGILIPEAGGTDGRSGLNGILARFYANQLGLPRLDNPEDGLPAIGDWSLMDTGNITIASSTRLGLSNLNGSASDTVLIAYSPVRLSAWSRIRLGWLTPTTVTSDTTLSIPAAHSSLDLPHAVKVPITANEYFLLENRMSRLDVEGRRPNITFSNGTRGVWVANDDYDAFIPGSGILIWHVDDAVIDASGDDKPVNSNPDYREHFDGLVGFYRKGIALEEADGLLDIGNTSASRVITSGIISFASISGSTVDPFYVGNNARFGPDTNPSSNSNLGYPSGIEIEILSAPGEVMDVTIRFVRHQDSWPQTQKRPDVALAPKSVPAGPDRIILNADHTSDQTAWSVSGDVLALDGYVPTMTPAIGQIVRTGSHDILFTSVTGVGVHTAGSTITAANPGSQVSTSPMAATFPGPLQNDIWGLLDGRLVWGIFGGIAGEVSVGSSWIQGLAAGDTNGDGQTELIALDADGGMFIIDGDLSVRQMGSITDALVAPVVGDLDGSGTDEIVMVSADGSVSIFGSQEPVVSRPVSGGASSPPVIADIDRDGRNEILFGGDSRVWVVRYNGVSGTDTPYELPMKDRVGPISAEPLVADLDGDASPDILVAARSGAIYAYANDGTALPGFPVLATGTISVPPLLEDLDGDGLLELVALTEQGSAHLWHLDRIDAGLTGSTVYWGQRYGNAQNTGHAIQDVTSGEPVSFSSLLPAERAYCYPNPIRGGQAYIRYYLTDAADVELTILDAVGRIIERITPARTDVGTDNEIVWDTSTYGSGIYLCRLEASNGSQTETRFIKTAIIR